MSPPSTSPETNDLICEVVKQQVSDLLSTQITLASHGDYIEVNVVLRWAGRDISDSTATLRIPGPARY